MKKQILVSLIAASLAALSLKANGGFTSVNFWQQYISQHSVVFYDGPVLQTFTSKGLGNGFYGALFTSTATKHGYGNEYDLILGRSGGKEIQWDANLSYWNLSELHESTTDIWALTLGVSRKIISGPVDVTVGACLESYVPMDPSFWKGGYRGTVKASLAKKLTSAVSLNGEMQLLRDDGGFGLEPSFVGVFAGNLSWTVGKVTFFPVRVKVTRLITNVHDGRVNHIVWGTGLSASF
jgi:hypothetical protein